MVAANIQINPSLTSNALGSFTIDTTGYIQGCALDSPNARYNLAGGVLATTETTPMWGGTAIYEAIAAVSPYNTPTLGNVVGKATSVVTSGATVLAGWSVFDQDYAAINTPQSPVPLLASGMSVHYYRLGSGARIAVQCDADLVSLQTQSTGLEQNYANIGGPALYWDSVNQFLSGTPGGQTVNSVVYSSVTGLMTVTLATADTPVAVGDVFSLSGVTSNSGTAPFAALNAEQIVTSVTSNEIFTFVPPAGLGTWITIGLTSGLIATNLVLTGLIKVLDVSVGNCMTVNYNANTGFATWNRQGSCAVILI
jgi:hypothetical protein